MTDKVRCAIYTRKSTEEGLEQDFNSLDAQRESCEAYIQSQRGLGWKAIPRHYDDGGISGGTMVRPALKALLADIEAGWIDLVVVYKVDRLTRSLSDFSKIIDVFDAKEVSFVSVTQQFNTANSMGRLTLNMLLSFAQFEREVTAERIRDKIAASKRKGMWMGGLPPLGYDVRDKKLVVNKDEASVVQQLFGMYLELKSVQKLKEKADQLGIRTKRRINGANATGGKPITRGNLYCLLHNPIYVGDIAHKDEVFPGQHDGIIEQDVWDEAQRLLANQAPSRKSSKNMDRRCMLTGLIFDETGDRLCPTYAKKNGCIHAYYISKRLMQSGTGKGDGWRLPAMELENAIVDASVDFLADERNLIRLLGAGELAAREYGEVREKVSRLRALFSSGEPAQVTDVLRQFVNRVTVRPGEISVTFTSQALGFSSGVEKPGHELLLPFHFKRRGVEAKIVLGGSLKPKPSLDGTLIAAIGRSSRWWKLLAGDGGWSIQRLAEVEQVDASDVTRFLPLAFLSPRIVEAVLEGRQPVDLNLEKIKKMGPLPLAWKDQELELGFDEICRS